MADIKVMQMHKRIRTLEQENAELQKKLATLEGKMSEQKTAHINEKTNLYMMGYAKAKHGLPTPPTDQNAKQTIVMMTINHEQGGRYSMAMQTTHVYDN